MDLNYLKTIVKDSDKPALFSGKNKILYKDLFLEISWYSEYLQNIGVRENDHCAILSDNSAEFIYLISALWNCGAVAIPLNVRLTDSELQNLLLHSQAKFLFVSEKFSERIPYIRRIKKIVFPFKKNYGLISFRQDSITCLDRTALIIYTSGTTSSPKGVVLSFNNLISSCNAASSLLGFSPDDVWLASLPFYHVGGLSIFVRAFINNSAVIVPRTLRVEHIIISLKKNKPTLASFVPTVLKRIIEKGISPNAALRYLLLGGGPADDKLVSEAISLGWNIVKVYGSTETSSLVSGFIVKENPDKIISSGLPLGNNIIKIIDKNGALLPCSETGEIVIEAGSVMKGYWNNEQETKKKLINNAYYSGDGGYIDKDGYIFVQSRISDLIISGGENINPNEIEELLITLSGIKEVSVFGLPDEEWGQIPVAALVAENVSELDVINFLKQNLASYKIPKKIYFIDELPKNALGKVLKEKLVDMMAHGSL